MDCPVLLAGCKSSLGAQSGYRQTCLLASQTCRLHPALQTLRRWPAQRSSFLSAQFLSLDDIQDASADNVNMRKDHRPSVRDTVSSPGLLYPLPGRGFGWIPPQLGARAAEPLGLRGALLAAGREPETLVTICWGVREPSELPAWACGVLAGWSDRRTCSLVFTDREHRPLDSHGPGASGGSREEGQPPVQVEFSLVVPFHHCLPDGLAGGTGIPRGVVLGVHRSGQTRGWVPG